MKSIHYLITKADPDAGLVVLFSLGRMFMVLGIVFRFLTHIDQLSLTVFSLPVYIWLFAILPFYCVAAITSTMRLLNIDKLSSANRTKPVWAEIIKFQVFTDLVCITIAYGLTQTHESDFYLFFYLPLLAGVVFLKKSALRTTLAVSFAFLVANAIILAGALDFPKNVSHAYVWHLFINVIALRLVCLVFATLISSWLVERYRIVKRKQRGLLEAIRDLQQCNTVDDVFLKLSGVSQKLGYDHSTVWRLDKAVNKLCLIPTKQAASPRTMEVSTADPTWVEIAKRKHTVGFRYGRRFYHGFQKGIEWCDLGDGSSSDCTYGAEGARPREWLSVPILGRLGGDPDSSNSEFELLGKINIDNSKSDRPLTESDLPVLDLLMRVVAHLIVTLTEREMYKSLVENVPLAIYRINASKHLTFTNQAFSQFYGAPPSELLGRTAHELYPKALADLYDRDDDKVFSERISFRKEEANQSCDGIIRYVQVFKCPLLDAANNVVGLQGMFWDIEAVAGERVATIHVDENKRITASHGDIETVFDRDPLQLIGTDISDLCDPLFKDSLDRLLSDVFTSNSPSGSSRISFLGRSGSILKNLVMIRGASIEATSTVQLIVKNIDTFVRDEERGRLLERLGYVNRVARSIAHDVRNPLQALMNYVGALRDDARLARKTFPEHYKECSELIEHIKYIVEEFGRLASSSAEDLVELNVNELINDAVRALAPEIEKKRIRIKKDFGTMIPVILGNRDLIRSVFINVVTNGIEAVNPGGLIQIITERFIQPEQGGLGEPRASIGVLVIDDGPGGIIKNKIMVAGYTTKRDGDKIRGMGLWSCNRILQLHGGEISVDNAPDGRGCMVTMHLK